MAWACMDYNPRTWTPDASHGLCRRHAARRMMAYHMDSVRREALSVLRAPTWLGWAALWGLIFLAGFAGRWLAS